MSAAPAKTPTYLPAAAYLPHQPPMMWLDEVLSVDERGARCAVTCSPEGVLGPFYNLQGQLGCTCLIELMAQCVGVWSGYWQKERGEALTEIGLMLGARNLVFTPDCQLRGQRLIVEATLLMQDGQMGSFECRVSAAQPSGELSQLAFGRLNLYSANGAETAAVLRRAQEARDGFKE